MKSLQLFHSLHCLQLMALVRMLGECVEEVRACVYVCVCALSQVGGCKDRCHPQAL